MPAIVMVIVAGALGGFVNALLTGDLDLPHRYRDAGGIPKIGLGVIGNLIIGMVAGFVGWAVYSPTVTFSDVGVHPNIVAGALLADVGGGQLLTRYVQQDVTQKINQDLLRTIERISP